MATSNVVICVPERPASQLSITIPGIGELRAVKQAMDGAPTPEALAMVMLGQISPALAPMTAVLRIADVAVQILKTFQTIPSAILSLDPGAIASSILALEKKLGFMAQFLPGVPYVKLVRDMLVMVEQILHGMATLITRWVQEMQLISRALESATLLGDVSLSASGYCSQKRLIEVQQGTQISFQDVGQIIKVVKMIADIVKQVIPFNLPGISQIAEEIDTIAALIPAAPGAIGAAEQERLLAVAGTVDALADKIHSLTVLVTGVVG